MKVVLDTNVWISSLLMPKSIPGKIISAWQKAQFNIVVSTPILDELNEVLNYPKIHKRLRLSQNEIEEYLTLIRFFAEIVELPSDLRSFKELRDIDDSIILTTFIASKANYLITGDQDLLVMRHSYQIITPGEFVEFL